MKKLWAVVGWLTAGLLMLGSVSAQIEKGHDHLIKGKYAEAVFAYDELLAQDSLNFEALYYKGVALYFMKQYEPSVKMLEKAGNLNPRKESALYFYLAEGYFYTLNYERALKTYRAFLKLSHPNERIVAEARKNERNAEFAKEAYPKKLQVRSVRLGNEVNSSAQDYNPVWIKARNELFFCSYRKNETDGDLYFTRKDGENWSEAVPVGPPINTSADEKDFTSDSSGTVLVFTRKNERKILQLLISFRKEHTWTVPEVLFPAASGFNESYPCLSADGKKLWFASERPGGAGGYDLYVCTLNEGKAETVRNLGLNINTPEDEFDVFVTEDEKRLFFSSSMRPGFGGSDIFFCEKKPDGSFSAPQNFGFGFNTPGHETDFYIDSEGKTGFYNRMQSEGQEDIYYFEILK